jgi:hypothetical protein
MGLTVSHPLTLLLFKDTIHAQIEAERDQEIQALRDTFATQKKDVEARMVTVVAELDKLNKRRDESYEAKFIRPSDALNAPPVSSALSAEEQLSLTQRTDEATKSLHDELDALTLQIQTTETKKAALQAEVDDWQRQFEAEINGQRSGVAGIGPRARSIQKDQLEWRRTDLDRLADELRKLAGRRVELNSSIASATERIRKEVERSATERAAQVEAEQKRIADMQRITQEEQMKSFLGQQEVVRAQIQASINSAQADKDRLSEELKSVVAEEASRLAQLREAPRKDMLSQTLALHHLFENPEAGGSFALMAYLVLAGLFLAIDTMPILVKFTSKKGEFEIRREQALKEAEEGAIFGNLPSDLRELTEPEREQLHKQVVAYYEREQERKLLLKEKEVAEARTKKAASEKHNELELAKRDKEIAIEMARLAGREHRAKEARFAAAVSEIDRQIGDPKKLKLSVMKQKVADAESDLPDADFGAAQA